MGSRIILDLCGGTGAWSKPYADAGYDVRIITLPKDDVCTYNPPCKVHGILAAPPCTEFARCGARWWKSKPSERLEQALKIVKSCLAIIHSTGPVWWVLENPVGRLKKWLGEPVHKFHPWQYGDPWTKRTWLWGNFVIPSPNPSAKKPVMQHKGHRSSQHKRTKDLESRMLDLAHARPDWVHRLPPSKDRAALRSITPPGFAQAFFEANP